MKNIVRFILLMVAVTLLMMISWPLGISLGDATTGSIPPPLDDPSSVAAAFGVVCIFNSFLISLLIAATRSRQGLRKTMDLVIYLWTVQFGLTQMETYFFLHSTINTEQILSIMIGGVVMSLATVVPAVWLDGRLHPNDPKRPLNFRIASWKAAAGTLFILMAVAYPLIYITFGYYVAWQNESVRLFYTHSSAIEPFLSGLASNLTNGVYLFQILRAGIWIFVSLPVIMMLRSRTVSQYLLTGICCALLPATLLFIPNPYMPMEVAMSHFTETSLSNLLWGMVMVWGVNRMVQGGALVAGEIK